MNGPSVLARRAQAGLTLAATLVLVTLMIQVEQVGAQTPDWDKVTSDASCAADSLFLISPEMIDLRLETEGRKGLTVSWPNLDLSEATCFSLRDTAGLDFEVSVDGGFGDRVDRVFNFSSPDSGVIGAVQPNNIIVTWRNEGPSTYGNIGGKLNLANNGGIWRYGDASGWSQLNGQLPMYWMQANTVGLAAGSGNFMVAGFSRGITAEADPVGLFTFDGANWNQIAIDPEISNVIFNNEMLITDIAVSPRVIDGLPNQEFAVGTARNGLFITKDGGRTWTQWTMEFDPGYDPQPTNFGLDVVEWKGNRVYAFVNNFGLFISQDNGATFDRSDFLVPNNLDIPELGRDFILPVINALSFHPTDPDRIAASLQFHAAYESMDGGVTWYDLYGDLVVPDEEINGLWVNSGLDFVYDDVSDQTMVMGIKQKGLFRTTDGGATWVLVGDSVQPDNRGQILELTMARQPSSPGAMFVLESGYSLLSSNDSGATWEHFASQPVINNGYFLLTDPGGSGDLTIGTWGGGLFIPGTSISLTDAYSTITSSELRSLDLGLDITLGVGDKGGEFRPGDSFTLVCQTFQGWAVWRGPSHDPEQMKLLGLFDRVNPEDCYEGYCGDQNIEIVPNCFAAKRAACFNLFTLDATPDTITFFDEEIYNGFTYNYAVTSFDYGNTALTTAENNSNDMLFSPRFDGDLIENGGISLFPGSGNQVPIQINEPIDIGEEGLGEIYVFPNPLRMEAGFPRDEGGTVTFKNIPEGSKLLIFTTAGDRIIDIGPETILGGNIHWDTRNDSGEEITSGVYLYKVEMLERDAYWGRLVVIR